MGGEDEDEDGVTTELSVVSLGRASKGPLCVLLLLLLLLWSWEAGLMPLSTV